MLLIDYWNSGALRDKNLKQIVGFAGNGALKDDDITAREFREWLAHIPLTEIRKRAEECLSGIQNFLDSGFALQDIVNQIGKRLGFAVEEGRYRGTRNAIGFDGVWKLSDGRAIVIEVKTTDAYRLDLERVVGYRRRLVERDKLVMESVSLLVIVGREDTGGLEAQIRGSRYAWDMRLISVDALLKIAELKEKLEEPTFERIHEILIPKEFTKLDDIADLVLSAAKDSNEENPIEDVVVDDDDAEIHRQKKEGAPVSFHESCVLRAQTRIAAEGEIVSNLIRRSRTTYSTADEQCGVVCLVSKSYDRGEGYFWFSFRTHQKEFLDGVSRPYLILGCGSDDRIYLIPGADFLPLLDSLPMTHGDRTYWHIHLSQRSGRWGLERKKGFSDMGLTPYLLPAPDIVESA